MVRRMSQFYPEVGKDDMIYDGESIIVTVPINANSVDSWIYVAPFKARLVSAREIHSVVGGASAAVRARKITDTSAPGAAAGTTVKELTTAAFDLTAAINTTQVGTLVTAATPKENSDFYMNAGDKVALDFSGTLTGLVGVVVLHIKRV
jgi:hypothetical protein